MPRAKKKRKYVRRAIAPAAPPTPPAPANLTLTLSDRLRTEDPRRLRFYQALIMSLPILTADDMDKIEPTLAVAIGRDALNRVAA